MIFYVGVGNEDKIIHRFISIIVGFIIAILTNEIILPTNNGLIVETGTHEQLINIPDGKYRNLYNMQFKKQEEELQNI